MNQRIHRIVRAAALTAALGAPASAHVGLDAPNGGEVFTPGDVVTVEWHVVISHTLLNWDLFYSTTGDNGPWIPIAMDLPAGSPDVGVPHFYDWTVPDAPSAQVRIRIEMDNAGTDYFDVSDGDITIQPGCSAPASFCTGAPNSNGLGAQIGSGGSTSVAANDFELTVGGASSNQPGLFYYGPNQIQTPFGDGFRCVGGGVFRLGPPVQTDAAGAALRPLDLNQAPANAGPGEIQAGATWNFQCWYRDPAAGGSGFNLSDGLSVSFCP